MYGAAGVVQRLLLRSHASGLESGSHSLSLVMRMFRPTSPFAPRATPTLAMRTSWGVCGVHVSMHMFGGGVNPGTPPHRPPLAES